MENKYKKYKNKLTDILRVAKQDYYSKLLDRNKKDSKGMWNVLNNIIKKNSGKISLPKFFINNDKFEDSNEAVKNFNNFFVSVGPKLAEKIPDPITTGALNETLISRNPHSMFLTAVGEKEVVDIVNKCRS